jgi:hypothetical protein
METKETGPEMLLRGMNDLIDAADNNKPINVTYLKSSREMFRETIEARETYGEMLVKLVKSFEENDQITFTDEDDIILMQEAAKLVGMEIRDA